MVLTQTNKKKAEITQESWIEISITAANSKRNAFNEVQSKQTFFLRRVIFVNIFYLLFSVILFSLIFLITISTQALYQSKLKIIWSRKTSTLSKSKHLVNTALLPWKKWGIPQEIYSLFHTLHFPPFFSAPKQQLRSKN